jgi:hypothetical protein
VRREPTTGERLAAEQEKADVTWLMTDPRGRRLVWDWLAAAGIARSSYAADTQGATDALAMAFREGERNRGLALQAQVMTHCPELFVRMLMEAQAPRAHTGDARGDSAAP